MPRQMPKNSEGEMIDPYDLVVDEETGLSVERTGCKILIVASMNVTPEEELAERLAPLARDGFRVVSASTSMAPFGERNSESFEKIARHMYYVTTVVLEKTPVAKP